MSKIANFQTSAIVRKILAVRFPLNFSGIRPSPTFTQKLCKRGISSRSIFNNSNKNPDFAVTHSNRGLFVNSICRFGKMTDSEDKKAELKKRLTPLQYHITQEKGTERAFTGKYNKCYESGIYSCVVCDQHLFASQTKFDSGCGWPAFNDVLDQGKVKLSKDTSSVGANLLLLIANPGMIRTEVQCSKCNAHLGHVFGDGPPPTKKRFCINSASLQFHPADTNSEDTKGLTML